MVVAFLITDDSYDGGSSSSPRIAFFAAAALDFCAVGSTVGVGVDDDPPASAGAGVSCGWRWNKDVTVSVMLWVVEV